MGLLFIKDRLGLFPSCSIEQLQALAKSVLSWNILTKLAILHEHLGHATNRDVFGIMQWIFEDYFRQRVWECLAGFWCIVIRRRCGSGIGEGQIRRG